MWGDVGRYRGSLKSSATFAMKVKARLLSTMSTSLGLGLGLGLGSGLGLGLGLWERETSYWKSVKEITPSPEA